MTVFVTSSIVDFSPPSFSSDDFSPDAFSGLELLATAVLLLDDENMVIHANAAAENLFELSKRQLVGRRPQDIFNDAAPLLATIEKTGANGASYSEQELELTVAGKARSHLSCTATAVDAPSASLLLEFRPIDRQLKMAREERLRQQAQENRELIRSLAHEIKNPLGGIRGAAQLLEGELEAPHLIEYTQVIISEADRLRSLLNRLLTPHRVPKFVPTNIHELLVRVKGVVHAEFPSVRILTDWDTSLPEFNADSEQLTQAILNILRNAAQAVVSATAGPEIRITTRVARGIVFDKRLHRQAVAISITDNGPGIPEAMRDRIFFPLVSGREGGSGLGLTIAQTFVAQHQGSIEVDSVPGRTVFTILLPLDGGGKGS